MANDVLSQLQQLAAKTQSRAASDRSFADRLRDERTGAISEMSRSAAQTFSDPGSVPMNPMGRMGRENAFMAATKGFAQPILDYQEAASRGESDYANILTKIAQLSPSEGVSISDQLKAMEAGYQIVNGELVPMTEGAISKTKEADLLKLRQQRLDAGLSVDDIDKQLGLDKKIGEDEVLGVELINDILGLKTGGLTGLLRGKVSATGLFSPYETAEARTKLKQLSAVLQLASAGKLKGQGTITENERKILREAVSSLGINEKGESELSDTKLRKELEKLQIALAKKSNDPELMKTVGASTQLDIKSEVDKYWK